MNEIAATLNGLPIPLDALVLLLALVLDLALGEPPNRLHPTVWIGKTVALAERIAPSPQSAPTLQLIAGGAIALLIPAAWAAAAWAAAYGLMHLHPVAYLVVAAMLLKTTFSIRMLHRVAADIGRILSTGDIAEARRQMSALVSRDTSQLTVGQMAAGAIESVAENITDSIVGPLLAFALFGLPGAVAYRAINTLDSMVGYHGRYEYLGKASARLDDLVNLIPARLAAGMLWIATAVLPGLAGGRAWRVMLSHRGRTESPTPAGPWPPWPAGCASRWKRWATTASATPLPSRCRRISAWRLARCIQPPLWPPAQGSRSSGCGGHSGPGGRMILKRPTPSEAYMTTVTPGTRMTLSEYRDLDEMDGGVCELINGEFCQMPPATPEHQLSD